MDARILFVVAAVALLYWLVRNHLALQSHSSAGTHPHRRSSDRKPTRRQRRQAAVNAETDAGSVSPAESEGMMITEAIASAPATLVMRNPGSAASGTMPVVPREPSLSPGGTSAASGSGNPHLQDEISLLNEELQQRERSLTRNRHAMEEVEKLKKQLFEKGREMEMLKQACARSDAALAHFRADAQRAAMFEQQLAEAQERLKTREQELLQLRESLEEGDDTLQISANDTGEDTSSPEPIGRARSNIQLSKQQLARELREAEQKAEQASQNALELRRLHGELEAVNSDHENAKTLIAELQVRVRQQQQALEAARSTADVPSAEISILKQTLLERQSQNEELRKQLARLSGSSSSSEDSQKSSAGDKH